VLLIGWGVFRRPSSPTWLSVALVDKAFLRPPASAAGRPADCDLRYAVRSIATSAPTPTSRIGVAALLGLRFQSHFDQPYRAQSPTAGPSGDAVTSRSRPGCATTFIAARRQPQGTGADLCQSDDHHAAGRPVALRIDQVRGVGCLAWRGSRHQRLWRMRRADGSSLVLAVGARLATVVVFHFVCFCWIFFRAKPGASRRCVLGLADWSQPVSSRRRSCSCC